MKKYKVIRERFLVEFNIKSGRLFFDDCNINKELDNTKMYLVLNRVMGNTQAGAVAKYAIVRLLKNGVPAHIIRDFTGYKNDVIDFCQDKVDEERSMTLLNEKCRVLDSAIRKSELFDNM